MGWRTACSAGVGDQLDPSFPAGWTSALTTLSAGTFRRRRDGAALVSRGGSYTLASASAAPSHLGIPAGPCLSLPANFWQGSGTKAGPSSCRVPKAYVSLATAILKMCVVHSPGGT